MVEGAGKAAVKNNGAGAISIEVFVAGVIFQRCSTDLRHGERLKFSS